MLTCQSCRHFRTSGCVKGMLGWPTKPLGACFGDDGRLVGEYEPVNDENEEVINQEDCIKMPTND